MATVPPPDPTPPKAPDIVERAKAPLDIPSPPEQHWTWPVAATILIWGIASFAIVPPLQMWVMEAASDAPNLTSAMNIGAFNLGNAIGAALGGGVIGARLGLPAVSLAGAGMAAAALAMLLAFRRWPPADTCPA